MLPKLLADELARVDGDNAGLISGGLDRLLVRYELMGLFGDEKDDGKEEVGEGFSDSLFAKRYHGYLSTPATSTVPGLVSPMFIQYFFMFDKLRLSLISYFIEFYRQQYMIGPKQLVNV